jgi:hypothetical protein
VHQLALTIPVGRYVLVVGNCYLHVFAFINVCMNVWVSEGGREGVDV